MVGYQKYLNYLITVQDNKMNIYFQYNNNSFKVANTCQMRDFTVLRKQVIKCLKF